jgi:hypothetical protein
MARPFGSHFTYLPFETHELMFYSQRSMLNFLATISLRVLARNNKLMFEELQLVYLMRPKRQLLHIYPNIFTPDSMDIRDKNVRGTDAVVQRYPHLPI